RPPSPPLFPYTTLFRSPFAVVINRVVGRHQPPMLLQRFAAVWVYVEAREVAARNIESNAVSLGEDIRCRVKVNRDWVHVARLHRSEEHTSELQSRGHLV